jgi:hypothetical protein
VNCIGVVFARCFKVLGALGIVFIKVDILGVRTKTDESFNKSELTAAHALKLIV